MSSKLELLRARVDFHQRRCRLAYPITSTHPTDVYFQAASFHQECSMLREAEAELAAAEKKTTKTAERE